MSTKLHATALPLLLLAAPVLLAAQESNSASDTSSTDIRVAEGPVLAGRIVDVGSGSAIAGVALILTRSGITRWTNDDGRFAFTPSDLVLPDTLVIRHIAYDSVRVVLPPEMDESKKVGLALQRRPMSLPGIEVSVEAQREAQRMARTFGGRVWDREDFEGHLMTAENPLDALRWSGMVSFIEENAYGGRCVQIRIGLGCALIMVNNVRMAPEAISTLPPETVESFVVLRPIEATTAFGTGSANGVVMIFTRTGFR